MDSTSQIIILVFVIIIIAWIIIAHLQKNKQRNADHYTVDNNPDIPLLQFSRQFVVSITVNGTKVPNLNAIVPLKHGENDISLEYQPSRSGGNVGGLIGAAIDVAGRLDTSFQLFAEGNKIYELTLQHGVLNHLAKDRSELVIK